MSDTAIKIEHVSKEYRLGAIGGTTLRDDLQRLGAKLRKKEDPTKMIGAENEVTGERFLALNDISFEVKKGEALGIIGHNGAGKSTLLKLLSRITVPTSGTISYNGRVASMLEVGTGFHPELTGRENVYMNGAILGMTKAEITEKFDEIVSFAEMERFIDTPVKRYSSGMYVKLAFSVAAHLDSEIMVMDEVLAVGDMKFQQKCLGRMSDAANSEGRTVLYVSHNMNTIRQLCSRCIVLDHGKVIFDGDVEKAIELYSQKDADIKIENICDAPRKSLDSDNKIHIDKLTFLTDSPLPVYGENDTVRLKIDYTAERDVKNFAVRIVLQSPDKIRVGMTTTAPCINAVKGGNSVTVQFPVKYLAPGKYSCFMVAYSVNDMGTEQVHDRVSEACFFEKGQDMNAVNNMTWNTNNWGFLELPKLKVGE